MAEGCWEYSRLTFALLGVTTPSDLIQDKGRTPFNVGCPIALLGFGLQEAKPLAQGLAAKSNNPEELMQAVLEWAGGQPFLTQKVCKLVLNAADGVPTGQEAAWIENLVQSQIIENWEAKDIPEHLKTIRDRLLRSEQRAIRLLEIYRSILSQDGIAVDSIFDQMELKLSGLVLERQGKLFVNSHI